MNFGATQLHFSKAASSYSQNLKCWPISWLRRREANAVFAELGSVEGERVLDLGCGAGFYSQRLLVQGPRHVTAVDNCSNMLKGLPEHNLLDSINCDAAELPNDIEPFDAIVCAGLLEFVPSPERVLLEARRISQDRCRLILLVPNKNYMGRLYAGWHASHSVPVTLFKLSEIRSLAEDAGWKVSQNRFIWPFSHVARLDPR